MYSIKSNVLFLASISPFSSIKYSFSSTDYHQSVASIWSIPDGNLHQPLHSLVDKLQRIPGKIDGIVYIYHPKIPKLLIVTPAVKEVLRLTGEHIKIQRKEGDDVSISILAIDQENIRKHLPAISVDQAQQNIFVISDKHQLISNLLGSDSHGI